MLIKFLLILPVLPSIIFLGVLIYATVKVLKETHGGGIEEKVRTKEIVLAVLESDNKKEVIMGK